jgi:hypothetical protein
MQVDINILIPLGTFLLGMMWMAAVVVFEFRSTA